MPHFFLLAAADAFNRENSPSQISRANEPPGFDTKRVVNKKKITFTTPLVIGIVLRHPPIILLRAIPLPGRGPNFVTLSHAKVTPSSLLYSLRRDRTTTLYARISFEKARDNGPATTLSIIVREVVSISRARRDHYLVGEYFEFVSRLCP